MSESMNRSDFFSHVFTDKQQNEADLSPHTQPLTQQEVLHLLRRTTFATSWKTINFFIGKTANEVVESLLNNAKNDSYPTPPKWINNTYQAPWRLPTAQQQAAYDAIYKTLYEENYELKRWWIEHMTNDLVSIREKMTLFWHGNFTSKFNIDQIMPAQLMYRQNMMLRQHHQGSFRALIESVIIDGAMLIFLNGQDSTQKSPNENFSRELLELYTVGIGNYTEKDVQEGARVFTGIRTNFFTDEYHGNELYKTFLVASEHDTTAKQYLGETIPPTQSNTYTDVYNNEIKLLVDIILNKKKEAVATFICEKLYRFFIYSNPSQTNIEVINDLAKTFTENNFEIRPVLARLFKSKFFFEQANIGTQIKMPTELIIGTTKHFKVDAEWKEWVMVMMGQELHNPPNVAGWAGYRKWMDTRTFPFAVQQLGYFVWNQKDEELVKWLDEFDNKTDAKALVYQILTLFLVKPPTNVQLNKYLNYLLSGSSDYEWENMLKVPSAAGGRLKYMLVQLVKSPEYFLC